jgi:hypothetical protein
MGRQGPAAPVDRTLRMERDIPKKATAFFAKDKA